MGWPYSVYPALWVFQGIYGAVLYTMAHPMGLWSRLWGGPMASTLPMGLWSGLWGGPILSIPYGLWGHLWGSPVSCGPTCGSLERSVG